MDEVLRLEFVRRIRDPSGGRTRLGSYNTDAGTFSSPTVVRPSFGGVCSSGRERNERQRPPNLFQRGIGPAVPGQGLRDPERGIVHGLGSHRLPGRYDEPRRPPLPGFTGPRSVRTNGRRTVRTTSRGTRPPQGDSDGLGIELDLSGARARLYRERGGGPATGSDHVRLPKILGRGFRELEARRGR